MKTVAEGMTVQPTHGRGDKDGAGSPQQMKMIVAQGPGVVSGQGIFQDVFRPELTLLYRWTTPLLPFLFPACTFPLECIW
jgi:hypothetical protein